MISEGEIKKLEEELRAIHQSLVPAYAKVWQVLGENWSTVQSLNWLAQVLQDTRKLSLSTPPKNQMYVSMYVRNGKFGSLGDIRIMVEGLGLYAVIKSEAPSASLVAHRGVKVPYWDQLRFHNIVAASLETHLDRLWEIARDKVRKGGKQ